MDNPASSSPPPVSEPQPPSAENKKTAALLKQIDEAFFTLRFYPVAARESAKQEAVEKIKSLYQKSSEPIRQLILYQFHEHLAKAEELKVMHHLDYFRRQSANTDPAQLRIQVYRAMFNYHYSLEGLLDMIRILGELGGDDATKLLTYHLSFLSTVETEGTHILRNALIDALGNSPSPYALRSLLSYVRFVDQEQFLGRILNALGHWDKRLDTLRLPAREKKKLREELSEVLTIEFGDTHYG